MTELDVSKNINLTVLNCGHNYLTSLSLDNNPKLTQLQVYDNQLTEINISECKALTYFSCRNNNLTEIDVSNNKKLEGFYCYSNQLTELDVSKNPNLSILQCWNNQLTELDVTNCTNLDKLQCYNNQLTELKVRGCTALTILQCYNNQLTNVDLSGCSSLSTFDGYGQNIATLSMYYDTANTGWINQKKQEGDIKREFAANADFYSDSGRTLELEAFYVDNGLLKASDVPEVCNPVYFTAQLMEGKEFTILSGVFTYIARGNGLSAETGYMDVTDIENVETADDLIQYFDVYDGETLVGDDGQLTVECNDFDTLKKGTLGQYDVTIKDGDGNSCLTRLEVGVKIDSTNFPDSSFLKFVSQQYDTGTKKGFFTATELDAVTTIEIGYVETDPWYFDNLIGIEYFTKLTSLQINDVRLKELDVSKNTNLTFLNCGKNQLKSLILGTQTSLDKLQVYDNQLTEIDISKCEVLTYFSCRDNAITELNVSKNTNLTELYCYNNQLTELNISGLDALSVVQAWSQKIGNLPLYYVQASDGSDIWVNSAMNPAEIVRKFNSNTIFQENSNTGDSLTYLQLVDGENRLQATSKPEIIPESVYFESKLSDAEDAPVLSGTFTFTIPEQYYSNVYMDVNVAKSLKKANDLLEYFTPTNAPAASVFGLFSTNRAVCEDFDKVQAGTPGQYPVTLSIDGETYAAIVVIGLDIDYQDGNGEYVNFPDPNFQKYLLNNFDTGGDGFLTTDEINNVTRIHIPYEEITNLAGIEYFTGLTYLYCAYNQLTELDVSKNPNLTLLNCGHNRLTALDLSNNKKLTKLQVYDNSLTKIDITKQTALTYFSCRDNKLTELDISNNEKLTELYCYNNQLMELDVSSHTALMKIYCQRNQLTELDVSNKAELTSLNCQSNQLIELKVSGCMALETLLCNNNQLTDVNLTDCSALAVFDGYGQSISTLPLYYDEITTVWMNAKRQESDVERAFATSTVLYSDSGMMITQDGFYIDNRILKASDVPEIWEPVYFNAQLVEGKDFTTLSGVFTYTARGNGLSAETGYMDLKDKDNLETANDLIQYFDVYDGETLVGSAAQFAVECADFEAIKKGVLGQYTITIKDGDGNSCTTRLEVGVNIDSRNFPDDAFRNFVSHQYDAGVRSGFFTAAELDAVITIDLGDGYDFSCLSENLIGIEYFTNLETLICIGGRLKELDVSKNKKLILLNCGENNLTSVTLGEKPHLVKLQVYDNALTEIDISKCGALEYFSCRDNDITSVDVSKNVKLTNLYCFNNHLTNLDISKLSNLSVFQAYGQTIGTLEMYYDAESMAWINEPKNANYVYSEFNTDFKPVFKENTSSGATIGDDDLYVNGDGALVATNSTSDTRTVYFATPLEDANQTAWTDTNSFNGTFSYAISDVTVTNGYIDKNKAKDLKKIAELFTMTGMTVTTGNQLGNTTEVSFGDLDISLKNPTDWTSIKGQIIGQYPMIVTYDEVSYDTVLEVGLEIQYYVESTDEYKNFPDAKFREYLSTSEKIDPNQDGFLTADELSNVKEINIAGQGSEVGSGCASLEGIEYFTNLTELKCSYNEELSELNLENNTALEILWCSGCALSDLELENHTALTELFCDSNQLKELDISKLTSLENLSCTGNQLTYLSTSGLENLIKLDASEQEVFESLSLIYQGDCWVNAKVADTDIVRTFSTEVTQFSENDTNGNVLNFSISDAGILTAENILPIPEKVYFAGDLTNAKGISVGTLNGTFTYYPQQYALATNTLVYTSTSMVAESLGEITDLKNLTGLFSVAPNTEEFKAAVEISMEDEESFARLAAGEIGTYSYTATLLNLTEERQIVIVSDDATVGDAKDAYLYADDFYIGLSVVTTNQLDASKVLDKSGMIYRERDATGRLVDVEDVSEFTVQGLDAVNAVGEYTLTIIHNDSSLQTDVQVTVLDDSPTSLIEIPAKINLTHKTSIAYAEATGTVSLVTNAEQVMEAAVKVYTEEASMVLMAEDGSGLIKVNICDVEGNIYNPDNALAVLSAENKEQTFKLVSEETTNLKVGSYKGTMKFTIEYREESDGNET